MIPKRLFGWKLFDEVLLSGKYQYYNNTEEQTFGAFTNSMWWWAQCLRFLGWELTHFRIVPYLGLVDIHV